MENKVKLIAWDIEDTLMPKAELESERGRRAVRANALWLLQQPFFLEIDPRALRLLRRAKEKGIAQGIISGFAYQFGINFIGGSELREIICPALIELAHKHAWEGMMLDGAEYDSVLNAWAKPSTQMYSALVEKLSGICGRRIDARDCLYVGDNEKDEFTSRKAGWQYVPIAEAAGIADRL